LEEDEEMKWDILCLTMPTRRDFLARLRKNIEPQLVSGVTFTVMQHFSEHTLGHNRQLMREESDAEYVSFVDDDDLVADNYVARILPLLDGVDYIGFRVQTSENGISLPGPTYHSLLCGGWFDKTYADGTKSWHRDISHLNPIRRELALAVPMYGGFAEDSRWANDLRALGIVKTEHYIEETMYFYLSRTDKTDGVPIGPLSAGKCPSCESFSTVIVMGKRACNKCGATFEIEARSTDSHNA
jgi:hypothetical protein